MGFNSTIVIETQNKKAMMMKSIDKCFACNVLEWFLLKMILMNQLNIQINLTMHAVF